MARSSSWTLQYESEGYPQPEVQWRDASGQNLTHTTQVLQSEEDPDLLRLHTQVVVDPVKALNWTLTVVNHPLGQVIQRPVSFVYGNILPFLLCFCVGNYYLSEYCWILRK